MEQYNIEGHGDLARDPKTGAIVNVNSLDYTHYTVGRNAKKSRNESCLLYTSPSPRDATLSRMPSSA